MRIAELHVYRLELPVAGAAYTMAGRVLEALDSTIVKLVSDTGKTGWGETCPLGATYQEQHALGARAALQQMAPALIGESVLTPAEIMRRCDERLMGHNYAKAAIDIAVMDLLGQHYRQPVSELLGGAMVESVPSYYALGIGEPEHTAAQAKAMVKQGYRRLQIKIGGRHVAQDVETIHKVFEQVGSLARRVADANRSLTAADAIILSNACANVPMVLEQPCNTVAETLSIRRQVAHPVFLDESATDAAAVLECISRGACDGFGLKLTRLGGLNTMATVRDICAIRSMPITCDDTWGGDIIAAACVHLGATVQPRLLEGVWISAPYIDGHYDLVNAVRVENGRISVPRGDGLGVSPEPGQFSDAVFSFA